MTSENFHRFCLFFVFIIQWQPLPKFHAPVGFPVIAFAFHEDLQGDCVGSNKTMGTDHKSKTEQANCGSPVSGCWHEFWNPLPCTVKLQKVSPGIPLADIESGVVCHHVRGSDSWKKDIQCIILWNSEVASMLFSSNYLQQNKTYVGYDDSRVMLRAENMINGSFSHCPEDTLLAWFKSNYNMDN